MNTEWLRDNVRDALADFHTSGNEQLGAMEGTAIVNTERFKRNPSRYHNIGGTKVKIQPCIVNIKQTRNGGKSSPLIDETTYSYSCWRRAIYQLSDEQRSWILYCYGDFKHHAEQCEIVPYICETFMEQCKGKRITGKVKIRIQGLAFLAVQVSVGGIKGWEHTQYSDIKLAEMLGVSKQGFYKNYKEYWDCLLSICNKLDASALHSSKPHRCS